MKDRFTRVLKAISRLATVKFPEGTTGSALDSFARRPLWDAGLDYDHGTGPAWAAIFRCTKAAEHLQAADRADAEAGMIVSTSRAITRRANTHPHRELIVVQDLPDAPGSDRKMMAFETITLAPIDLKAGGGPLLTADERAWLNEYHAGCARRCRGRWTTKRGRGWNGDKRYDMIVEMRHTRSSAECGTKSSKCCAQDL